jgi:hypothetical protein
MYFLIMKKYRLIYSACQRPRDVAHGFWRKVELQVELQSVCIPNYLRPQ